MAAPRDARTRATVGRGPIRGTAWGGWLLRVADAGLFVRRVVAMLATNPSHHPSAIQRDPRPRRMTPALAALACAIAVLCGAARAEADNLIRNGAFTVGEAA